MNCTNCGKPISDQTVVCMACGVPTGITKQSKPESDDRDSFLIGAASFLLPIVGLILYLIWKDTRPISAKFVGKWAIIGFLLQVVFYIVVGVFFILLLIAQQNQLIY